MNLKLIFPFIFRNLTFVAAEIKDKMFSEIIWNPMEGSLGGGRGDWATGFYLFSNPVIQFPRLGWQIWNSDVKTPTSHRRVIYWIFWWKSINYVWSLKFVILVVTIKGISQQFKNHLSLKYLIEVKLQSSFFRTSSNSSQNTSIWQGQMFKHSYNET